MSMYSCVNTRYSRRFTKKTGNSNSAREFHQFCGKHGLKYCSLEAVRLPRIKVIYFLSITYNLDFLGHLYKLSFAKYKPWLR